MTQFGIIYKKKYIYIFLYYTQIKSYNKSERLNKAKM